MYVTIVYIKVKPEFREDFIIATQQNHHASVQEQANMRFDFLQSQNDPDQFVLYEAYRDGHAAAAHKETQHYLHWRDQVSPWMAEPRKGIQYQGICPELEET